VKLALLHRRITTLMALAALAAFAAGAGAQPYMWGAALGLVLALVWRPSEHVARAVERLGRLAAVLIFSAGLLVAVAWSGDYLPYTLAFLLVLLVTESLRSLDARNELRLYALSFAVLIASTAYYPGVVFASAFIAYVGLATLALKVGYLRKKADEFSIRHIPLRRSVLLTTAALSSFAILTSALVFLAFPRLPKGWIGSTRAAAQGMMVGFGEGVSLGDFGGRIQSNPEIVLRVEFDGSPPEDLASLRWRGRSYDRFDGIAWIRSRTMPAPTYPPNFLESQWGWGDFVEYSIFGGPPGARVLFGLHPVLNVISQSGGIRPRLDRQGDIVFAGADSPNYTVSSGPSRPPVAALRSATGAEPAAIDWYLQLPPLPARMKALADSLTRDAPTRYDAVRAVESWLRSEFSYTLELPSSAREATLDHFLFERRAGHCEYFSTAMAILLRAAGVPARNVNGFLGGEWNASGGYLAVTQNDAHSWVEVWFPGLGWVPFDPTPPGERSRVVGMHAGTSLVWPILFWWDGLQHRWTKWVLFYNLDKQLSIARRLGDVFGPDGVRSAPAVTRVAVIRAAPWLVGFGAAAILLLILLHRRAPRRPLSPESRLYLRLRSAYTRAGYGSAAVTPLELIEILQRRDAPGRDHAIPAIELYLESRFGPERPGRDSAAVLREGIRRARRQLRRERRTTVRTGSGWQEHGNG
jgi:protein-glutamine gamma-glutamyltransferase